MNVPIHRRFDAGMTEQFLQHFWLHPAFDCTRCIGVAQCVHTESPDSCLIAQFVKVGIIGTVLRWLSCSPVDKDKITHDQPGDCPRSPVDIFQCLREQRRFLLPRALILDFFQNFIGPICQRDGAIALLCFRRTCTPHLLFMPKLQRLIYRKSSCFPVDGIPCQPDHFTCPQPCF